ncbi:MAG: threonine/homoserine/homoserine lactone efflux protein [Crocinitomix sp.]
MIEIIFGGIGYGLLLSIMVGPAFFILIETSITKGVRSALYLDLGVLISDLVYVTIAFLFFQEVHELMESENRYFLKVIGGAAFVVFGITNLMKAKKPKLLPKTKLGDAKDLKASNHLMMVLKGFMINALNPGVLFYWLTMMSLLPEVSDELNLSNVYVQVIYITLILITFFSIDILKIIGAKKLKEFLTPAWIRVVNLVLGSILMLFGLLFLVQGIRGLVLA